MSNAGRGGGEPIPAADVAPMPKEAPERSALGAGQGAVPPGTPQVPTDSAAPSMLIRVGHANLEVDSIEPAMAAVRTLAQRLGGYVAGTTLSGGEHQVRSASLELRIPSPRWQEAIRGLDPIGEMQSVSESTQDVGEEYVDLEARIANAKRLEERLTELLRTRTGKLEDVLAVERELARVREEIDRIEGRMRFLRSRVAMSHLTVMLQEPAPLVGMPGDNILADAFRRAWRNFVQFIAWLIAASGILVPLGILVGAAWLLLRGWKPWRRARKGDGAV